MKIDGHCTRCGCPIRIIKVNNRIYNVSTRVIVDATPHRYILEDKEDIGHWGNAWSPHEETCRSKSTLEPQYKLEDGKPLTSTGAQYMGAHPPA